MQGQAITLKELAELTNSRLIGDQNYLISGVADLESATPKDASFLANSLYSKAMRLSSAGVIFTNSTKNLPENRFFLICQSPVLAFQIAAKKLLENTIAPLTQFQKIHPSAIIHNTAVIGSNVVIGPQAVIDAYVQIDDGTRIGAGCVIAPHSKLGKECVLHPKVVIREACEIGDRVILQPGVVIGGCGFGFAQDEQGHHIKLDHFAGVVIESDVEIGANTTIDRGRLNPTRIGRGTKIDNLVMIAHGVEIGEDNIIVAQTGIAGSAKTGKHVMIGGQVAINGHITLCDRVMIAAKSGVVKSIDQPGAYGGIPAVPIDQFRRQMASMRRASKSSDSETS